MSNYKYNILNRIYYLFQILNNNDVIIDNLPSNIHKFNIEKLLYLEKQLLEIINKHKIDINNINTKIIYKNVKGNERINILDEIKRYFNMITDKTSSIYRDIDTLIKNIESNQKLNKTNINKDIDDILSL